MKFLGFIKEHWKVASILVGIIIATCIGVAVVSATTVILNVDVASIDFPQGTGSKEVKASLTVYDGSGTGGAFTWAISDPSVASAEQLRDGVCAVVAQAAGKTYLTISYQLNDSTSPDATANPIPINVALVISHESIPEIMTTEGPNSYGLVTCNAPAGSNVVWNSSNTDVALVETDPSDSRKATVRAISGGHVKITASVNGMSSSFDVMVGVKINTPKPLTLAYNNTKIIETNSSVPETVHWWSDNPLVATVDNKGVVKGVSAGTANIYASCKDDNSIAGGAGDFITVNVPFEVLLDSDSLTMNIGDQVAIPTTADSSELNCTSENTNIVIYDSQTKVFKAVGAGNVNVHVSWVNGTVSDEKTVNITVINGFSLSNASIALNKGKSQDVSVITASDNPISWEINDTSIADFTESADGKTVTVTAKAAGFTTLTARQEIDGVIKSANCEVRVLNPVNNLTLLYNGAPVTDTISFPIGTDVYITAYLNFDGSPAPDDTNLSWISSNEDIITLTPSTTEGQQQLCAIHGVGGGIASITVVSEDGLYVAKADFYVTEGVESVTLDKTEVTAQMSLQRYQLSATVLPDTDGVNKSVTWSTLDSNVVTVDQNGLVTFVGPGTTYVSVTSNADASKVAYCQFHITQQVEGITMDYDRVTMNVGDDYRLTAVITPDNATDQTVTWSSSNPAVVTVDESGMLHAVSSGNATIVVQTKDGGFIDMTNVTVLQPVTSIELSETEMSVKKGTIFWLNATVVPNTADNKNITWASSDTSLATVDQTGMVTTLAVGTVTISCVSEDNGAVAYCVVEITEPVTGLSLNTTYQEMVAGTKFVIVPTVLPVEAPNKNVTFVSSDPEVATVDENGVVTALIGGKCEILVTTEESKLTATCTIVVKEFVKSIEITDSKDLLNVGSSVQLKAEVLSETASDKGVYWTSSNPAYATVDQTGKVTGIRPGSVVITATAADGGGVSDSVVIRVINPVTSITFDKNKLTMYVGDTVNIAATVNPQNASIKDLLWTSDDETIAKVYPDGDVEGISSGRTIIHATSKDGNDVVANCTVIVKDIIKATSININSSDIVMLKGKTRTLSARIYPKNTNETVRWLSTDTSIVQVDDKGNIVTVGAGECQVIAYSSAGTVEDACTIHSIAMYCTDMKLEQYDTFNLYVDGAPQAVSWRSSNPRIASVDQSGLVVGRMPGECVITATVAGKTVTCYVKVMAVDPGKFINRHD